MRTHPGLLLVALVGSLLLATCGGVSEGPLGASTQPASPEPVLASGTQTPVPTSVAPGMPTPAGTASGVTIPAPTGASPLNSEVSVASWNPPPYDAPLALRPQDHFYFGRPIPSGESIWLHPLYRYGNTHFGEEPTHTGVDIVADLGTPVLAVGAGEVVWAGYGLYRGIEDETDPYGLSVAIEHEFGYEGQSLYSVYGHLDQAYVHRGQLIDIGQVIGSVGNTGHASGPHLHFEVRVGENRYFHTRNPELWLVPPEGWGVLVGRFMDSIGRPLIEYPFFVRNLETDRVIETYTYGLEAVHSDEFFEENVVIGDLPAGPYEVKINYVGHAYTAQLYIYPGQTNVLSFHGRKGFTLEEEE